MKPQEITKQQKQVFLRNQILQGGIDPQTFMDYMGTVKEEGQNIDINNWTIEELKQLVHDFKQQIKTNSEILQKVQQSQVKEAQTLVAEIIKKSRFIKKQKINWEKGLWDYEINEEQQCRMVQKQFDFNAQIKPRVHVVSWVVRSHGGFLGFGATNELWLKIETNFTTASVQRSNSDFQWFRSALLKFNPGYYVPPLNQLRVVQPDDKKGLQARARQIERFLNSIVKYQYTIQSVISKIFLTEVDHSKLTNFKNKERTVSHQKNVGRIQNLDGKFNLEISKRTQALTKHSALFGKVAHEVYSQIEAQISKVLSDMETLSKHVLYVSNSCVTLHQKYTKICGLNEIKDSNMNNLMTFLYNIFSSVGKNIKQHMTLIKQFSDEFVKPDIKSWQQFLLHDKRFQKQVESYLTFKAELLRKKERFFNDFNKWELDSQKEIERISRLNLAAMEKEEVFGMMFPRENKTQQEIRVWVAYLSRAYEDSFKKLLKAQQTNLKQKLNIYMEHSYTLSSLSNEQFFSKELKQLISIPT